MTNDSSSQFSCSRSRETLGICANAQTLTDQPAVGALATTTIHLTPNWEVLNDESQKVLAVQAFGLQPNMVGGISHRFPSTGC